MGPRRASLSAGPLTTARGRRRYDRAPMRRREVLTTLGLCGVLLACVFGAGAPAAAQTAACQITIADATPPAGSILMVTGDHFPTTPRTVPIVVDGGGQVGLATVDDTGHFADPVRLPANLPEGQRTISAECGITDARATSQISIVRAGAAAADAQKSGGDDDVD